MTIEELKAVQPLELVIATSLEVEGSEIKFNEIDSLELSFEDDDKVIVTKESVCFKGLEVNAFLIRAGEKLLGYSKAEILADHPVKESALTLGVTPDNFTWLK